MNTPEKKHSVRPADPVPEQPTELIALETFPDGSIVKFAQGTNKEGKPIYPILGLVNGKTVQIAGTAHFEIADMICMAVNLVSTAAKNQSDEKQPENDNSPGN